MRILFLTQVLPYPLDAGPKVRAYHTLKHLTARHEVHLISFVRAEDGEDARSHLSEMCASARFVPIRRSKLRDMIHGLQSLATNRPFLMVRDWRTHMVEAIRELMDAAGGFDVVHADQLMMAPYASMTRLMSPADARPLTVLDQHNAVFQIPARMAKFSTNPLRRLALLNEARKLAGCEVQTCSEFDRVVFVTEEDKLALSRRGLREREEGHLSVIPIGTELDPLPDRDMASKQVLFVGGMHWPPNAEGIQWFAREAWPLIRSECNSARLVVVGKNPPKAIKALGDPSIEIAGFVEDITGYLARAAVTVVPLFSGGGMRVKILEAWARGIPVVSTRVGAEGLLAEPGRNILFAETATEFRSAVQRVLNDAPLASELARYGLRTVQAHYDWETVYQAWDEVYGCESSLLSPIRQA